MSERKLNQPRTSARINPKLEKTLAAYMAAAGAAGVSLLSGQQAEAKIVYTPTNTAVGNTSIDLNHDGIADFNLTFHEIDKAVVLFVNPLVTGNEVRTGKDGAAAGFFGVPIGPAGNFVATSDGYGWGVIMAVAGSYTQQYFFGDWANAKNRYLELKFVIDGRIHYGWARLTVPFYIHGDPVMLTGYAYETTPNTPIIAGHTSGPEKAENLAPTDLFAPASQSASLGMLARGADGLAIWRREEEAVAG
jgi:hypothetical protein